ncbi:hypothetical protein AB6N24_18525 [Cellulomonas sp. 179-A 4D5 NHS]|uniref:hypothetical protein n=1 Tax=Cellulomonas sp. 179-A 4D5 NHS TaxID=3142378 RepID=UPI0039A22FE8
MTLYGFRLYQVHVTSGRTRPRLTFGTAPLDTPARQFAERLTELQGRVFVREAAYQPRDGAPDEGRAIPARTPVMRIDQVRLVGNSVEVGVTYGRKGEYDIAVSVDGGADIRLDQAAASRPYRAFVHFPAAGDTAVMVSEVVGRTHVGETLLKRLSVENFQDSEAAGTAPSGPVDGTWLRWLPRGMFDENRIREVLTDGTIAGVRLHRAAMSSGGRRTSRDLTLHQNGLPATKFRDAQAMVERWLKRHLGIKVEENGSPAVGALVELIEADVAGVGFTDGVLEFTESGRVHSLGPSNLERIMVYPIGDQAPTTDALRAAAAGRLRPLVQQFSIPIDVT